MATNHQSYVLGFAFSEDGKELLVIKKSKPEWQAGKFNGIGGKIEPFEPGISAMVREFSEETGLFTDPLDWDYIGAMQGTDYTGEKSFCVKVFVLYSDFVKEVTSPTEEPVQLIPVAELDRYPHIPNLDWLVPMALNYREEKGKITGLKNFVVTYE